ncbi:MAG: alpha/beta hydrolase [Isosphaeraceae bacterium]
MRVVMLVLSVGVLLGATSLAPAQAPGRVATVDVWPATPPGEKRKIAEEQAKTAERGGKTVVTSLTNVSHPTISIYPAPADKATGAAILVCPGGGYNNLAWDHEGEQVAAWLNSIGVTAAVLKYRVPRREGTSKDQPPPQALMDAQRSLSLLRSKAKSLGVDPKRIGMLGFSAGGHLTAWASTNSDKRAYKSVDASDDASCRPDFSVLIYPGGVVKRGTTDLAPEIKITSQSPPMFFAHAGDDPVSPENSVLMYIALKRAGVPAELHIYNSGGHGFGMRSSTKPSASWPARCEAWLRDLGVIKAKAGA